MRIIDNLKRYGRPINPLLPGEYVSSCPTLGRCIYNRMLKLDPTDRDWQRLADPAGLAAGKPVIRCLRMAIVTVGDTEIGASFHRCCDELCGLPLTPNEAYEVNRFLGNTLPEYKPDDNLMELLDGF